MKKPKDDIIKARRLFASKKYAGVVRYLEPKIPLYMDNREYFFILGYSCLRMGDSGGSIHYIKKALQLEPTDIDSLLIMSVLSLKRGRINEAVKGWLEVLELDPENKKAQFGLDQAKKIETQSQLNGFLNSGKDGKLLPSEGTDMQKIAIFFIVLFLGCSVAGLIVSLILNGGFSLSPAKESDRVATKVLEFDPNGVYLDYMDNASLFILDEEEITVSLELLKESYGSFSDNIAQREINRLLHSNATIDVKRKISLLKGHLGTPDMAEFKKYQNFKYGEVAGNLSLYADCFVLWSGKITNLKKNGDSFEFDLMVGYADETVLEGIVPVKIEILNANESDLSKNLPIEVLGKVIVRKGRLTLEGKSLHFLQ